MVQGEYLLCLLFLGLELLLLFFSPLSALVDPLEDLLVLR